MRITAVSVENIGGLVDQRIELPADPLVAFAGPNGSGKSKLLASMIGHWINNLPAPRAGATAKSSIEVSLSDSDRISLNAFQNDMGWTEVEIPERVTLTAVKTELSGQRREADPPIPALTHFYDYPEVLKACPGLNPMYLPAERRLLPANKALIDLGQLADAASLAQLQSSRTSIQNYGRLDDQEFEQFAKALCIAASLPSDSEEESAIPISKVSWEEFQETVNDLLYPKKLLPLTRAYPDQLRILLPNGDKHDVPDLSSGERQALIIMSRVMRAGAGHSVVLIDEPDAYLHPNLSQRLTDALVKGAGKDGQLILSTHSPAILDRVPPSSIMRLDYDKPVRALSTNDDLIDLHRNTGFRASALTQAELLIVTEGVLDETVLKAIYPKLARSAFRQGEGRPNVLNRVKGLLDLDTQVIGIVDRDVSPPVLPGELGKHIVVLPTADMEGAFLSDDAALEVMIEKCHIVEQYRDLEILKAARDAMYSSLKDNVVAEIAQAELREKFGIKWPSSRGVSPIDQLRDIEMQKPIPTKVEIDSAISRAIAVWDSNQATPWTIVRGKYILGQFTSKLTHWKTGNSLLEAVAKEQPTLKALSEFENSVNRILP